MKKCKYAEKTWVRGNNKFLTICKKDGFVCKQEIKSLQNNFCDVLKRESLGPA